MLETKDHIEVSRTVHELNAPFKQICQKETCILMISVFNKKNSSFGLILAKQVVVNKCSLTAKQVNSGLRCAELVSSSKNGVLDGIFGSGVVVENEKSFFLKGKPFFSRNVIF